ncbi:hypothetical protein REPUB_Repub04eG0061500 [Reevesia pubescens]
MDDDLIPNRINVLRLSSMDNDWQSEDHVGKIHAHPSSHMDHMDRSVMVFFTLNDLKVEKSMPIYFPKKDPSKSPVGAECRSGEI